LTAADEATTIQLEFWMIEMAREKAWSLQDAKNRLSEVVDRADRGEPQLVTKHGRAVAYVVGVRVFESMRRDAKPVKSLGEHLSAFPAGGPDDLDFERLELKPRTLDA
jgi:prevent-host-death family protein